MLKNLILTKLIVMLVFTGVYSQKTIVGVVTNKFNEPIVDVKVSSKNNLSGVLTDRKGEYNIEVSKECEILMFTYKELVYSEHINGRIVINKIIAKKKNALITKDYRFNVMLNAGGAIVWGAVSGSLMLSNQLSVDFGLGLGKVYGGITFYMSSPFENKQWQPYVGANIAYFEEFMGPTSRLYYLPVGMRFLNSTGISISFELAVLTANNDRFMIKSPIWAGVRFGKYF